MRDVSFGLSAYSYPIRYSELPRLMKAIQLVQKSTTGTEKKEPDLFWRNYQSTEKKPGCFQLVVTHNGAKQTPFASQAEKAHLDKLLRQFNLLLPHYLNQSR